MHSALIGKLSKLPDDTKVFCGHEYTLANLSFAKHVEPDNQDVLKKISECKKMDISVSIEEFIQIKKIEYKKHILDQTSPSQSDFGRELRLTKGNLDKTTKFSGSTYTQKEIIMIMSLTLTLGK